MKQYTVKLVQRSAAYQDVVVEAGSEAEAFEKGEEILAFDPDNILAFGKDEVESHDVVSVEEVSDG
jgi:hypothetical protein